MTLADKITEWLTTQWLVNKINGVLGIKLYDWQIDYIFHAKNLPEKVRLGRNNGKTLAHILRILFNKSVGIRVYPRTIEVHDIKTHKTLYFCDEPEATWSYMLFYSDYLLEIRDKLSKAGLDKYLCEVNI